MRLFSRSSRLSSFLRLVPPRLLTPLSWSWPWNRSSAHYCIRTSRFLKMLLEDRQGFVGGATSEDAQPCPLRTFSPHPVALSPLSSWLFLRSHLTWEWTKTWEEEEERKGVEEVPNLIPTVWGRCFGLEKVNSLCEGWFTFQKRCHVFWLSKIQKDKIMHLSREIYHMTRPPQNQSSPPGWNLQWWIPTPTLLWGKSATLNVCAVQTTLHLALLHRGAGGNHAETRREN